MAVHAAPEAARTAARGGSDKITEDGRGQLRALGFNV
jgi:hypothetical protein